MWQHRSKDEPACPGCRDLLQRVAELEAQVAELTRKLDECGFTSFPRYLGGDLKVWAQKKYYMPRVASAYGNDPKKMPFDFPEVLGAIAPRAVFVNAPAKDYFDPSGVKECVAAAAPGYDLLGAKAELVAAHPDCGHDFPPEVREQAYRFLVRELAAK